MNIINDLFGRITTTLQSQLTSMSAFITRIQNFGTQAAQFVQQKVQKFFQTITQNPRRKEDYWKIFGLYFSKRFVVMSIIITGALGYILIYWMYPWADGKLWTANIGIESSKLSTFSGKARLFDTQGIKIYEGNVKQGRPEGYGVQYDSEGRVIYAGGFQSGKYFGEGRTYDTDGTLIYEGAFANNLYEGEGKLYNSIGKIIYAGEFAAGMRSGIGIEYNPDTGEKMYYGSHANDVRSGNGVEYEEDGKGILYEGDFKDGIYFGSGKLYSNAHLLYSGSFANGNFEGVGDLYDLDTGVIKYSGEFKNGLYDGNGKLYDVNTSVIVYEGSFSKGKRQGVGKSFDKLGSEEFSGNFRGDSIDYVGYLGADLDKVTTEFGQETYRTETDGHLILTYLSLDSSIVFKVDDKEGKYVCEKIILGTKKEFMGLSKKSSAVERRNVMGEPYSSINYACAAYYRTVFSNLSINIKNISSVPTDKYIMNKYFIRFYFNEGRTELKCVEICSL